MQPNITNRYIHLIANPGAARGRARLLLPVITHDLRKHSLPHSVYETRCRGDATTFIRSLDGQEDIIIAIGGDGTVNEVVNGIAGTGHAFGVVPAGRGNDFARLIGMAGYRDTIDVLRTGSTRLLDIGEIRLTDSEGRTISRYFINTLGIGFDAIVALRVLRSGRGSGILPYLAAVIRTLSRYSSVPSRIRFPEGEINENLFLASFGNGTTSGGGFILSPRARPDDGVLDLCFVKEIGKLRVLRVLPKTFRGTHIDEREVMYVRSREYTLETAHPLPVHADGEILTDKAVRLEVTVSPHSACVLTNPAIDLNP